MARGPGCYLSCACTLFTRQQFVQAHGIEANDDLVVDDQRRRGAAVVGADQFKNVLLVGGHVAFVVLDTSILEVGLGGPARRSTGLRVQDDLFTVHANNGFAAGPAGCNKIASGSPAHQRR